VPAGSCGGGDDRPRRAARAALVFGRLPRPVPAYPQVEADQGGAGTPVQGHGQVAAWLTAADGGPVWVAVLAAHMASATVQISLADAVVLRDGLTRLIEAVGHAPGGPS
jgi:hypothetical protein